MCDTCGCDDGASVRVEGEHAHVQLDGTVVHHSHEERHSHGGSSHAHSHDLPPVSIDRAPRSEKVLEIAVLSKNDALAARNRAWLTERAILTLNLMSSPGAGKTTLLERTLRRLSMPSAVLEGDQETSFDAERIRATGVPVVQVNTGKGCHLEADMVRRGLDSLAPVPRSVLFVENVGNLVCPALFDLGEDARVILFSVTEGEDKPLKYPYMFRTADLVLLTKADLLPHLEFDLERARRAVAAVRPDVPIIEVSARTGVGLDTWHRWIEERMAAKLAAREPAPTSGGRS